MGERGRLGKEWDEAAGGMVGRDPRSLSVEEFAKLGHTKRPLLTVIRANCLDCCGGSQAEVRRCAAVKCPMWPYRMNSNPFAAPSSEAQMAARQANAERLRQRVKQVSSSAETRKAYGAQGAEVGSGDLVPPNPFRPESHTPSAAKEAV